LTDNVEERYFDIASLKKHIVQPSKNKPIIYLLPLFAVLCVGFFFIKPYFIREEVVQEDVAVVSDTIKQNAEIETELKENQKITEPKDIKDSLDIDALKPRIENEIKAKFDKLYSKYSEADLMYRFDEVQQTYQNIIYVSFEIANTLYSENPKIPINEVNYLIKTELDKNTATYLSWLIELDKKQRAKSKNNQTNVDSIIRTIRYPIDEINSLPDQSKLAELEWLMAYKNKQIAKFEDGVNADSLMKAVQLLVQQEYDKIFSIKLFPIDILDVNRYNNINSKYHTTRYNCCILSASLSSTYPQLSINELEPIKNWITAIIIENKTLFDNWLKDYCQNNKDEIKSFAKENGINNYHVESLMGKYGL
jgi:hypothetical protein